MSECKEWDGHIQSNGYGWRCFRGKSMYAHRAAWIERNGIPKNGLCVLHKCNNRKCVNLEHLYLGTHSRNMKDRAMSLNQNNGKLSPSDVLEIRDLYKRGGITQASLAIRFGITSGYISELVRGKYWEDVK
jgi:hypothetical protein